MCGQCFVVCPQDAKQIVSEVGKVRVMLQSGAPVVASLAPSFIANYAGSGIEELREALKKLSMMGLVEIKQGKGTFVKSVDLGLFMKPMLQLVDFDEIDIETIYSAREYIEGGIAYLAAQQRTDGELAILESILGKLKAAIQAGDILSIFEYDRAFHDDLARAAHNPILFACLQTIEEINEACVKRYDKFLIMLDDCYNEHFQIFTAVANQQPEKAQAAMAQHARSSKKILL